LKNQQSEKSHPFQKLVDVRQAKQLIEDAEGLDEEIVLIDQAQNDKRNGSSKGGKRATGDQRRTESRLERRRPDEDSKPEESPHYHQQFNESNILLQKLMENLKGNPALQNEYIKQIFKLEQIQGEADLQDYKNLLNSMAALFYTNHRIGTVTGLFYQWRQLTAQRQEDRMR
jgi:hypothetical protein